VNIPGAAIVGLCAVTAILGGCAVSASTPEAIQLPGKVIPGPTVTQTVEVPGPAPAPTTALPLSCDKVINLAAGLYPAMTQYRLAIAGQGDIIDQALAAMVDRSPQELNDSVDQQNALKNKTLPAVRQVSKIIDDLEKSIAECEGDQG